MKYAKNIPQTDLNLSASLIADGWIKIKEAPNLFIAFLLSIPFMVINALICYLIINQLDRSFAVAIQDFIFSGSWSFTIRFDYIIYIYLTILLHELIHLLFIPNFYKSDKTYLGIKLWGGFVFTTETISKSRFILITIAPFLIISVILPVILEISGLLSGFVVFLVFLNALASSVDLLNAFIVTVQTPGGSIIVNNGFETYYSRVNV